MGRQPTISSLNSLKKVPVIPENSVYGSSNCWSILGKSHGFGGTDVGSLAVGYSLWRGLDWAILSPWASMKSDYGDKSSSLTKTS